MNQQRSVMKYNITCRYFVTVATGFQPQIMINRESTMKKVLYRFLFCMLVLLSVQTGYSAEVAATIVSATASTVFGANTAGLSFDNNPGTRWESIHGVDPQWIFWDLGSSKPLSKIIIDWEAAAASNFTIEGSQDSVNWNPLSSGGVKTYMIDHVKTTNSLSGSYRFVRMKGSIRTTPYGYSIWEVTILVSTGSSAVSVGSSSSIKSSSSQAVSSTPSSSKSSTNNSSAASGITLAPIQSATASTVLAGNTTALSFDKNSGTRWESIHGVDPQWIYWDLGSNKKLNKIIIDWEAACAANYTIEGSLDKVTWTQLSSGLITTYMINHVITTNNLSGSYRYVRMNGKTRTTPYGYSIWETSIYIENGPVTPVNITLQWPYIQYLEVNLNPADNNGYSVLKHQNVQSNDTLSYNDRTLVSYSFGGMSLSGLTPVFKTTDRTGNAVNGNPGASINVNAYNGQVVQIYLTNLNSSSLSSASTSSKSSSQASVSSSSSPAEFNLISPADGSMITTTRKPTLRWNTVTGTSIYEVWVNITRNDYDWYASGNLLDRYTKVGETTGSSFTLTSDLADRWTYKWFVKAVNSSGIKKTSNILQFSVYIPTVANTNDGINVINGCRDLNKNGTIEPFEDWHNSIDTRLNDLMNRLTPAEKFKQCFYGGESDQQNGFCFSYGVESFITTVQFNAAKTRMGIPMAFTGDKIHGWKTIFPTQLGLAATRDMNTVYQCGNLQRVEQKSFGFTGTLMPLAEVNTKVLYPRFQEGNGENADEAAAIVRAILCGMQGGPEMNPHSILATVKHWPSQGAGGEGPLQYDAKSIKYHMKPWYAAVEANAASIMPGYSSCPFLDPTGAGANSSKPIIDYLKNVIGFKGFIVTDWLGANSETTITSMGAGIDVMGGAPSGSSDITAVTAAIGQARINEAARRVLDMKLRLGLFENPYGDPTCTWNAADNHQTVLNAAKKSITLLKNNGILPLRLNSGDNLIVAGPRATWVNNDFDPNVIWQSIYYSDPFAKNYFQAFTDRSQPNGVKVFLNDNGSAKAAVVVIGEKNYTHASDWPGTDPNIPADQLAVIQGFKNRGIPVITVIISPRPYVLGVVNDLSDAIMMVYRGGSSIAEATAALCYGDYTPSGKLPFQLPRSMAQIGTDNPANQTENWDLPYDLGATDAQRLEMLNLMDRNQPVPSTYGNPLYPYGFGLTGF